MWLPRDAGVDGADLDAGHGLGGLDRLADRAHGPVDVGDDALAQAAARHVADAEDGDAVLVDLADDGRDLGGADVEADDDFAGARFHCLSARSFQSSGGSGSSSADADTSARPRQIWRPSLSGAGSTALPRSRSSRRGREAGRVIASSRRRARGARRCRGTRRPAARRLCSNVAEHLGHHQQLAGGQGPWPRCSETPSCRTTSTTEPSGDQVHLLGGLRAADRQALVVLEHRRGRWRGAPMLPRGPSPGARA